MLTKFSQSILVLFCCFLVTSCSMLSPVPRTQQTNYVIDSLPPLTVKAKPTNKVILVLLPQTNPLYDTSQMAYTTSPYQINYFAFNRWAQPPANMLQPLLVQSLQQTRYFKSVLTPPAFGNFDYVLSVQINRLEQDFTTHPSLLRLVMRVDLSQTRTNKIIASKTFSLFLPAPADTPYGGAVAANQATKIVLSRIVAFCLQYT